MPARRLNSETPPQDRERPLGNAEIAARLETLAQLLSASRENPYKVKAYRRAAAKIRNMSESIEDLVRQEADLTAYAAIGSGISSALREIVATGTMGKLEKLRSSASAGLASIAQFPRLDPQRVLRVYKKLGIDSIDALREKLETGEIEKSLGARMTQHIRQGITETRAILLHRADEVRSAVQEYLLAKCGVTRAEVCGDYRRRVETIEELVFLIQTDVFGSVVSKLERFGGRTPVISVNDHEAVFALSAGIALRIRLAAEANWGLAGIACTGSQAHISKLQTVTGRLETLESSGAFPDEQSVYGKFGLDFIEPELREGRDEVDLAAQHQLPALVSERDVRGELHAHTTSSDGAHSIEQMARAAEERGYEYLGITDHSQSLKIARGLSMDDLWKQIREIDRLNQRLNRFRVLKSAEVDILADGSLDYPDQLLRELDYTVCSIHSRFALGKTAQTERILRAMDNKYFNILGHATGRLLLKRPGYEIDVDRVVAHAKQNRCFFEINSSPDRLDLSAANARVAAAAGVKIAVSTDSHSTREFALIRYGLDQARRAGLTKNGVLNCLPCQQLQKLFQR